MPTETESKAVAGLTQQQRTNIDEWTRDLRSGNYRQGTKVLHRHVVEGPDEFCCLGVAAYKAELDSGPAGTKNGTISYSFPREVGPNMWDAATPSKEWMMERYGMPDSMMSLLMTLNDGDTDNGIPQVPFQGIAKIIDSWAMNQPVARDEEGVAI